MSPLSQNFLPAPQCVMSDFLSNADIAIRSPVSTEAPATETRD
jgi:hypothetical protein